MSDINLLPGIGLFLIASWLILASCALMLAFTLAAAFSQKQLAYRQRLGFKLFLGMWLPFLLGWVGALLGGYAPLSFREAVDRGSLGWIIVAGVLLLLTGIWLGIALYRRSRKPQA